MADDFIVSGSSDRSLKIWHTETGDCIKSFDAHKGRVVCVAISNDDLLIVNFYILNKTNYIFALRILLI